VLLCLKNKLILRIKLKIINQRFEGTGGAQNYVLRPRAQKCVNPALNTSVISRVVSFREFHSNVIHFRRIICATGVVIQRYNPAASLEMGCEKVFYLHHKTLPPCVH
jgi:hypothetical protein